MNCTHVQEKLHAYIEGDARRLERLLVNAHMAHCRACRAEYQELTAFLDAGRQAVRHPHPKDRFDALLDRIAVAEAVDELPRANRARRVRMSAFKLAAAAIILIMAGAAPPLLVRFVCHRAEANASAPSASAGLSGSMRQRTRQIENAADNPSAAMGPDNTGAADPES